MVQAVDYERMYLERQLNDEIRRAGDLEAALRLVLADLDDEPLTLLQQRQLAAYVKKELARLVGQ